MNKEPDQRLTRSSQLFTAIVVRSTIVAVILGSVLAAVNQWEAIFGVIEIDFLSLALVYCTPFIVVTISQIAGYRQAVTDAHRNAAGAVAAETFARTTVSHGIPMRALQTGLAMGAINTSLVLGPTFLGANNDITVPYFLLGQAFTLPVMFGIFSQAVSYRRAMKTFEGQSV